MTTFSHNCGRLGTGCLPSLTSANNCGLQSLSDRMAKVCKQYIINADRHSHCSLSLCSRWIYLTGCQLKIQIHYLFIYVFIYSFIITVSDYVLHSNNDGFRHGGPGHGGEQVGHSGREGPQIEKEVSFYPKCHFTTTFWGGVSIIIVP